MNEVEKEILERVLKEIDYYNLDFSLSSITHQFAHKKVYEYLKIITDAFGTYDYMFIYALTKLEEKHGQFIITYLYEILDNYCNFPNSFSKDIAFASLYNIALHHNRYFETDLLYKLISDNKYIEVFRDYPLVYEIFGRYFGAKKISDKQFMTGQASIRSLINLKRNHPEKFYKTKYGYQQTGDNVALKVGVVAATCQMFDDYYSRGILGKNILLDNEKEKKLNHLDELNNEDLMSFFLNNSLLTYNNYLINEDTLNVAKRYAQEAIAYNPNYPKYPYLMAQLIFYECAYKNVKIDFDKYNSIKTLVNNSRHLENNKAADYELRVGQLDLFLNKVDNYMDKYGSELNVNANLEYYRKKEEFIKLEECPPPQKRINPTAKGNDSYAFISYSTKDFKRVYCDLLTFINRGISFWYDAGVIPGEEWHRIIEEKIKNAECIICYLSENFIKSNAILKELSLFKKYGKQVIWIDLTRKKQISKIIVEVIRNAKKDTLGNISSSMLNTLTDLINDDIDMITCEENPLSEIHVDRIQNVITNKFPNIINNITSEGLTVRSNKIGADGSECIPNEDYIINDKQNNIYVVLDGISRKKEEYKNKNSIAYDISKLFADTIHQYLLDHIIDCSDYKTGKLLLEQGFAFANEKVNDLLTKRKDEFEGYERPGTVGIVAIIINHILIYASVGDCMGILVRGNRKIIFADKQTTYVFDYLKKEKDRSLLASKFINISSSPYGYGVINGQKGVIDYIDISYINLEKGDTIYLVSDGISDFIQFAKPTLFNSLELEEIINLSNIQDDELNKPYKDDKTILRIKIANN